MSIKIPPKIRMFLNVAFIDKCTSYYKPNPIFWKSLSLPPIQVNEALGLADVKNPLPAGYIEMYEGENKITIPVHFNSHFLIGPEGAHLNISGISGLASKTSYAMF